jgi:hypothetical protein
MDCLGDPADFGKRTSQAGRFIPDLECSHDTRRFEIPSFSELARRITSGQFSRISARLMVPFLLRLLNGP